MPSSDLTNAGTRANTAVDASRRPAPEGDLMGGIARTAVGYRAGGGW